MKLEPHINAADVIEVVHSRLDLGKGLLDHSEWRRARPIKLTQYWSGEPAPVARHAEARIIWTDLALFARFDCRQNEPLVISSSPQTSKKTIGLWDRDVCEIFLAPDTAEPNRYFEFEVAPTGEWIDLAIHVTPTGRETDWEFHSGMTTATSVSKERVVMAMNIPWDDWIHKPTRGEQWRVNLFRCVGQGERRGYLTWRPTRTPEPSFHVPQAFGWLRFG